MVPGKTFWAKGIAGAKVPRGGMRPHGLCSPPGSSVVCGVLPAVVCGMVPSCGVWDGPKLWCVDAP